LCSILLHFTVGTLLLFDASYASCMRLSPLVGQPSAVQIRFYAFVLALIKNRYVLVTADN